MYATTALWDELVQLENHYFQVKADINGVTYGQDQIMEMSADVRMFSEEQPGVGACLSAELKLKMLAPDVTIPRMALIEPYVRVTDGTRFAEWIPQGKFFIDTRETTRMDDDLPIFSCHAFDAMLKTEADYPSTTHEWSYPDVGVVQEIADTIGVKVDPRTWALMTNNYQIPLPDGYTMREVLGNIASMYAGNWMMGYDGKLLLIALGGIPPETNLLVDGIGDWIDFGACYDPQTGELIDDKTGILV